MIGAMVPGDRLLPASLPFRFFAAALIFHAGAWGLLLLSGSDLPGFLGGPGPMLAALHMITLGVAACTVFGAAIQLLPVAGQVSLAFTPVIKPAFWTIVIGLLCLFHGMGSASQWAMEAGAALVIGALAVFALLIIDLLRRIAGMPEVTDPLWVSMASLLGVLGLAATLVADGRGGFLADHRQFAAAHGALAIYGFMGMLVFGFSPLLMPMFTLGQSPDRRWCRYAAWLSAAALAVALAGLLGDWEALILLGGALGLAAAAIHLWLMARLMKSRMRKRLGESFVLVRLSWGLMPVSLLLGLAAADGLAVDITGPLFGFIAVFGWLLSLLTGVLQRIMPFLASMHAVAAGCRPLLPSALTDGRAVRIHLPGHCAGLALVAVGIAAAQPLLVRLGAACGLAGALALLWFAWGIRLRYRKFNSPQENR
ncbi:MAG TPA: hypothetical protein HPQ04_05135 [Rhodospirillaceae bacterium]|nr:hypothetical protein [Rhodospirillaceae bacterium]